MSTFKEGWDRMAFENEHSTPPDERPVNRPLDRTRAAVDRALHDTREAWPGLSTYERFEEFTG